VATRGLGPAIESRSYTADHCNDDGTSCDDPEVIGSFYAPSPLQVDPALFAPAMIETLIGYDREVRRGVTVGFAYASRELLDVLEDVTTGADDLVLATPGAGVAEGFDRARRQHQALQLRLSVRRRALALEASYVFSKTRGDYPGLFSPDNGQVEPHLSSQYDLIETLANRDGALPQDRPHYLKLDGFYRLPRGFTVGARGRALSGTPVDVLGKHYKYGTGEVFVLPRGAAGRTPFTWGLDLHVDYERDLGHGLRLHVFADLLNATGHQGAFAVDEDYTTLSNVNPIVGGSFEDLLWAKERGATTGAETTVPIKRNPHFGQPSSRYRPRALVLGARVTF